MTILMYVKIFKNKTNGPKFLFQYGVLLNPVCAQRSVHTQGLACVGVPGTAIICALCLRHKEIGVRREMVENSGCSQDVEGATWGLRSLNFILSALGTH